MKLKSFIYLYIYLFWGKSISHQNPPQWNCSIKASGQAHKQSRLRMPLATTSWYVIVDTDHLLLWILNTGRYFMSVAWFSQVQTLIPAIKDRSYSTYIKETWNGKDQVCSFMLFIIIYYIQHVSNCVSSQKFPDIKSFNVYWAAFDLHKPKISNK